MVNHLYFIGIGGIGMSGLARIAKQKGILVSGSDIATNAVIESLKEQGITVFNGHSSARIDPSMTIVYSTDIKEDNPELQAAQRLGCTFWHRSDLLAYLIQDYHSFAVSGTHGKTTTTSLLTSVLLHAGMQPTYAIGGILVETNTNASTGTGDYFVLEADESDRSFLKYSSTGAIVTNIDADHLEYYDFSMKNLENAFKQFCDQVDNKKYLFWCQDDPILASIAPSKNSYGEDNKSKWRVFNIRSSELGILFDINCDGKIYADINLALKGKHNALNGAAVFGLASVLGIDETTIRQAFNAFKGVKRRCEVKAEVDDVLYIDDYAHHPTEVETTLDGLRKAYGSRRLLAIFQPHRFTRTQNCLGKYGHIFNRCDCVIFTDIFGAGEKPIDGLSVHQIIDEVKAASNIVVEYAPRQDLAHYVRKKIKQGDLIVSLGAGDVTKISDEILSCK